MLTRNLILIAATVALAFPGWPADSKSGYAAVNGLKLYYEINGTGQPLVLLHGGLGSTGMYSALLPQLASHQVISVDLQAHGRTADIERPLSVEDMADDIAGLLTTVLVSTAFRKTGWYPEVITAMSQLNAAAAEAMKPSPLYQTYAQIAPKPADWPVLVTKTADLLKQDYDWSKEVAAIRAPTLLVFGDADAIRPAHMVEFYELLGGGKRDAGWEGSGMGVSRMAVLPGVTHYNICASPALGAVVEPFLDAPMPAAK